MRKKDISGLDYIRIPDTLTCPDTQDERILKEWHTIEALKEKKILNLSGFTNTDLKLEYGVGNLTKLTDYDNNYVTLSRSLARIAELLTEQGLKKRLPHFWNSALQPIPTSVKTIPCLPDITWNMESLKKSTF